MRGSECNRGDRDLERVYQRKERKGWNRQVPLESFFLLARLNHAL